LSIAKTPFFQDTFTSISEYTTAQKWSLPPKTGDFAQYLSKSPKTTHNNPQKPPFKIASKINLLQQTSPRTTQPILG
jgi:hypothetical protein